AVEPHQGSEQPPVRLGSLSSHQIALPRKPLLKLVKSLENTAGGFFISLLGGRETGAINAVVYGWIDNFVDGIDLAAQRDRIVIGAHVSESVKRGVEHANDLG